MSRTYKTRPMWVQHNDPKKFPTYARHDHMVTLCEAVGEEEYEPYWAPGQTRIRTLYRYWNESVPCTLNVPEETTSAWRFRQPRSFTNEEKLVEKHCYTYLRYYSENWRSRKNLKVLTNSALRGKVKQKLNHVVSCGNYDGLDSEDWYDVDPHVDSKYDKLAWWD